MKKKPKYYVNVFFVRRDFYEAHDGVYTNEAEAMEAAEEYKNCYAFTLTDIGKIRLFDPSGVFAPLKLIGER